MTRRTTVGILADQFTLNGQLTYAGQYWDGARIEGLLMNARLVQGIFDDRNPDTVSRWAYPDTGRWDAERNTDEFVAAMDSWRAHGLLAFTLNLQGGSPHGYSQTQPWENTAIRPDGTLDPAYLHRLAHILDRADALGVVVILGLFYFGQAMRMRDEAAITAAVDHIVNWLFDRDDRHVLIEINNECDIRYEQPILRPDGVVALIERVKAMTRDGRRFLVSTSFSGGALPTRAVLEASDFALLHGNGVDDPARLATLIDQTRAILTELGRTIPIVVNEDDHFDFDQPVNHMTASVRHYASWGYFDYRMAGEGFEQGFQSVPVDWSIRSARKRGFFELLRAMTSGIKFPLITP